MQTLDSGAVETCSVFGSLMASKDCWRRRYNGMGLFYSGLAWPLLPVSYQDILDSATLVKNKYT